MCTKAKALYMAIALGLILPSVMLSVFEGKIPDPLQETTQPEPLQETSQTAAAGELTIPVMMDDGTVEQLALDKYLTGVVLQEMPADFELEALKAQAVVARTYTLRRYDAGFKHADAAICTDPSCCQDYCSEEDYLRSGGDQKALEKVLQAVRQTQGLVLLYNGELIEATYFSCSGGMTEDAQAVWGSDIPYLQATQSPGEEAAVHYSDTVRFTAAEFERALGVELTGLPETWFQSVTYTAGGGVDTIVICGRTYDGVQLRSLLGLRSTAFIVTAVGDTVTVTTKGFGHRVGMSQYGADAMAAGGSDYTQILAHYYKGTELALYAS